MIPPALQGPCRDEDPELFFGDSARADARAKKVCARCPVQVRAMCLTWAIEQDVRFGVFGGLTARERGRAARCAS